MVKKLGKYELIEQVGRGAMGSVYKAHDPSIGRLVALKTISSSLVDNTDLLERFYREAQSAGGLQHPNIVTIYELGQEGETPFIAMEFLEGESLESLIERRANLSLPQKVGLIVPVIRALEFAHSRGVIHRDIKPANVMLSKDGTVKVVDFGIARLADVSKTRTDVLIGTLAYMSSQQIQGQRGDVRSDIWAVGVTFYELLCSQRPFEGENAAALMLNIIASNPTPIPDLVPECPPELQRIVEKMLQKRLNERFQTMEEVLFELGPVWKNMQEASITNLIADAEAAIQGEDFPRAREVLRRALQLDSGHGRVKPLLEQVNTQIRRIENRAQIEKALETGRALLKQGRYADAKAEAEAALELDPNFGPARELLANSKQAAETARSIQENLQAAKQRFAEDALTEAAKRVDKVLELDPENADGRTLQRQIQEKVARREEQTRRSEIVYRARKFWGDQQLEECIQLLADAHKEFPGDSEIAKVLQAAREDHNEQKQQQKVAEARKLAAAERFDEAMALLKPLLDAADPAVQKLYSYVRQEKETLLRNERLATEQGKIQALINEEKFSEAVSKSEGLLKEFPAQTEIVALVKFARNEIEQLERRRQLVEALRSIQKKMDSGKFQDAIGLAEKELIRSPGNAALEMKLGEARAKQKEKEANELLQKRIGEIKRSIKRGQHTDAVDLARQTLTTLGPNPEIAQLLRAAGMELEQKRQKREEQEERLAEAQALLKGGRFEEARELLQSALDTKLLTRKDSKVRELLDEIDQRVATPAASSKVSVADLRTEAAPTISSEAMRARSVEGATLVQPISPSREQPLAGDRVGAELSATVLVDPQLQPNSFPKVQVSPAPSGFEQLPEDRSVIATPQASRSDEAVPMLRRLAKIFRAPRLMVVGGAFTVLALVLVAFFVLLILQWRNREEIALRDRAGQLEKSKDWPAALTQYESLARHKGRLAAVGNDGAMRLKDLLGQEESLMNEAKDAEAQSDIALAQEYYDQVAGLEGDKEQQAREAIERLSAPPPPPKPTGQKKSSQDGKKTSTRGSTETRESQAPVVTEPQAKCELLPSSIPIYMGMADDNRATGRYTDAEREYNAILQCEPQNEPAREGLRRARAAQTVPNRPGN